MLVTGATGFVGRYLVRALIESKPGVRVVAHVRNEEKARTVFGDLLETGDGDGDGRLSVVVGDLGDPELLLGLSPPIYAELTQKLTSILHCGAAVSWVRPYSSLRPANVDGTAGIVKLAFASTGSSPIPVVYISTISAGAGVREELAPVMHFPTSQGYAASKHMGELIVDAAGRSGLPTAIIRLGMVVADPDSGYCSPSDFVPRFVGGCLQSGAYPTPLPAAFEMVTVVDVASTIVAMMGKGDALYDGGIYHISNPDDAVLSYDAFGAALAEAASSHGINVVGLPHAEWARHVRAAGDDNPLSVLIDFVADPAFFEPVHQSVCDRTYSLLSVEGVGGGGGGFGEVGGRVVEAYVSFLLSARPTTV